MCRFGRALSFGHEARWPTSILGSRRRSKGRIQLPKTTHPESRRFASFTDSQWWIHVEREPRMEPVRKKPRLFTARPLAGAVE
jgi:hypothetical protein